MITTASVRSSSATVKSFLEFLPVSLFGGIMGLSGLSFCMGVGRKDLGFYGME
jgi:hypothetical protein